MNTELAHLALFGFCYTSYELWRGLRTLAERPAPPFRFAVFYASGSFYGNDRERWYVLCLSCTELWEFIEKYVRADPDAIGELVEMNSQSTPTTVIDGEIIIGFDRQRISEKLGL